MAEFNEISPNAPGRRAAAELGRQPLPADQALERAVGQVLRAEELQLLVHLRLAGDAGAGDPDRHRHLPGDALQARCGAGLRLGRIHHARRALGLAHPLHALDRRLGVLRRRVPAHVPRPHLRQLPQAARADLDLRLRDLPVPDGRGLHGLPAALGPDELLGRAGDREPVRRHSLRRPRPGAADPRRLRGERRHAQPLLQLPRHRRAAGAARPGGRPPDRAARSGLQQSRRHRDQGQARPRRPSARRHSFASVLHGARHLRRGGVPDDLLGGDLLRARGGRLFPRVQQLHPGRFAEDAEPHRAGLVLHAVLFDAARHHQRDDVRAHRLRGRRRRLRRLEGAAADLRQGRHRGRRRGGLRR